MKNKNNFVQYQKDLEALKKNVVKVGLPAKVGGNAHSGSSLTLAQMGAVHEYGSPENNIPKRSFLREPMINHTAQIKKFIDKKIEDVALGANYKQALDQIGLFGVNISKRSFRDNNWKPNAPATLKQKGTNKSPLIDSGQLFQSITFDVEGI